MDATLGCAHSEKARFTLHPLQLLCLCALPLGGEANVADGGCYVQRALFLGFVAAECTSVFCSLAEAELTFER